MQGTRVGVDAYDGSSAPGLTRWHRGPAHARLPPPAGMRAARGAAGSVPDLGHRAGDGGLPAGGGGLPAGDGPAGSAAQNGPESAAAAPVPAGNGPWSRLRSVLAMTGTATSSSQASVWPAACGVHVEVGVLRKVMVRGWAGPSAMRSCPCRPRRLPTSPPAVGRRGTEPDASSVGWAWREGELLDPTLLDDHRRPGRHLVPEPGQLHQRFGDDSTRLGREVREPLLSRIEEPQGLDVRAVVQGVDLGTAGITHRVEAFAVHEPERHLQRLSYAGGGSERLDEACHPLEPADRVLLQPEGEREVEHHLGVRRPLDGVVQIRAYGQHHVAAQLAVLGDVAVVHEHPGPVAERMTVRLLHRGPGGRPDVREEHGRRDLSRERAQVAVTPGGCGAAEEGGDVAAAVPAEPETGTVRDRGVRGGTHALLDARALRVVAQLPRLDRAAEVRQPTTHGDPSLDPRTGPARRPRRCEMVPTPT